MYVYDIDKWQYEFVIDCFENGVRIADLESEPAPWLKKGLEVLEKGETLTIEMIKSFNS